MTAPRYAESIPAVTAPINIPDAEPEMTRARFLAGVTTGAALLAVAVTLLVFALVIS